MMTMTRYPIKGYDDYEKVSYPPVATLGHCMATKVSVLNSRPTKRGIVDRGAGSIPTLQQIKH